MTPNEKVADGDATANLGFTASTTGNQRIWPLNGLFLLEVGVSQVLLEGGESGRRR
jgi:hypothetical protein